MKVPVRPIPALEVSDNYDKELKRKKKKKKRFRRKQTCSAQQWVRQAISCVDPSRE
jgi:hypothetical protein